MPNANPLLLFLRGLTKKELEAIPARCDWCRVRDTDVPVDDLSMRIRDSIVTNADNGNITYQQAMQDIRRKVILPGPETVTHKIRTTLRETRVAKSVGGGSAGDTGTARVSHYTAQLYGALDTALLRPYTVKLQFELNQQSRPTPDLYVESHSDDGDYIIEVKRGTPNLRADDVRDQLRKYSRAMQRHRTRHRKMTFLCIVGEDTDLDRSGAPGKSTPVSEYMDVPPGIDELSDELDRVEVVSCRYKE